MCPLIQTTFGSFLSNYANIRIKRRKSYPSLLCRKKELGSDQLDKRG